MSFNFMAAITICSDFGAQKNKDDQNHEKKMEKMQESTKKDLEEWKNKHTETNKFLKLKII